MAVPSNTTAAAAIALTTSGTITQQVDDSGTTYDVWYKYTNASAVDEVFSLGVWGDLGGGGYRPSVVVWKDEAATIFVHNGFTNGAFTLSIPAGWTYWFKVGHTAGDYIPSNLSIKFLIGPAASGRSGDIFIRSASMASWMIDAGLTGLPGGFIDADASAITGFVPQFITGEAGDVLPTSGRVLFIDEYGSLGYPVSGYTVYLYDSDLTTLISSFDFDTSGTGLIRTHQSTDKFYIVPSASGTEYRTVDADGNLGPLKTISHPVTPWSFGVNSAETIMYLGYYNIAFSGQGVIKRWDMVGGSFLSDLTAGDAGLRITDILVLPDDSLLACFFKFGAPRDVEVRHYDESGSLLNTFTFSLAATITSVNPRLGYSSDTGAFWILNHLTTGYSDVRKIRISDGAELVTSLTPDVEQSAVQQADPPLPHTSNSCPIIELRASSSATGGIIGPLAWVHWPRRIPGSPVTSVTDTYSDMDMQCPAAWENGFKEGLVTQWGDAERPSSDLFTGEWQGSTFNFQIADKSGRFRAQFVNSIDRYWGDALTTRMTTRANREALGTPFTVFSGPIIDAQPTPGLGWDITLGDVVSQGLLSDRFQVPWRMIRDSFLSLLDSISDQLDYDQPEPIIYGINDRVPAEQSSPATDTGLQVTPIYLGIKTINALEWHVWMVAGHAVQNIEIFVDGVLQIEFPVFSTWMIPHHTEHQNEFGAPYEDYVSDTYGDTRRYTLIYGNVGRTGPDNCATGASVLTAMVWGIETVGDGSGAVIEDRFEQYKHFLINYVANQGPQSYMTGAWLSNPTWDIYDGPVEKVNEASFDDAAAIAAQRLSGGYPGAAAIGFNGERASAKYFIANWNRSCGCRFGITHEGQMFIYLLSPTSALKAAAPLYTDAYEILEDGFSTEAKWDEHATSIQFRTDFDLQSGVYKAVGVVQDLTEINNYGRDIPSEVRTYPYAPGLVQATHLANLELLIRKHPPRYIRLEATIGHDPVTLDSLGYRDIGDYIRYVSFDAVQSDESSPSATRQIRMAQVITPIVRVGWRRVGVIAMDCEDLIGYDIAGSP